MFDNDWKLRDAGPIDPEQVAKIASALKSLAVYSTITIEDDDNPEELQRIVQEGLDAIDRIFEY